MTYTCPGCGGTLSATRRCTIDQVRAVHEQSCPIVRARKAEAS